MIYKIIAFIILALFYGCYFVKMLSQRKKGIKTDQIGKGKVGFEKFVEITMKVSAVLVFAADLISIIIGISRGPALLRITGAAVSAIGTAVFITSVLTMRDSWRAGVSETDKTELITSGIYQISRNPAFLGFDLLYIGILLMFFNLILCVASVFAIVMLHLQIVNVEEDFLISAFGDEYIEYKKKVCRYLGRKKVRR